MTQSPRPTSSWCCNAAALRLGIYWKRIGVDHYRCDSACRCWEEVAHSCHPMFSEDLLFIYYFH